MKLNSSVLDDIGILEGTDKSSLRWDYLRQYQEIFSDWRDVEFNMIEIGVAGGSSLFTWQKFFPRANIVGIDIDEQGRRCARERITIEIGSQADEGFLSAICDKCPPSIVVDDGSHQADHIMVSFRALFPLFTPGGWYVVEDLNITGGRDEVPITPHAFFSDTALALLNRRPSDQTDLDMFNNIDRMDLAPGIIFIRKKDPAVLERRIVRESQDLVWRTTHPNNYLWLSEKLMEYDTHLENAERAGRRATDLHPTAEIYQLGLSKILQRRQDFAGATSAARRAIEINPAHFECHYRLGEVLFSVGDFSKANEVFEKSIEVAPEDLRVHILDRRRKLEEGG
jgi:hypothetical protein